MEFNFIWVFIIIIYYLNNWINFRMPWNWYTDERSRSKRDGQGRTHQKFSGRVHVDGRLHCISYTRWKGVFQKCTNVNTHESMKVSTKEMPQKHWKNIIMHWKKTECSKLKNLIIFMVNFTKVRLFLESEIPELAHSLTNRTSKNFTKVTIW